MFGEALFAAAGSYREFLGNCFFSIAPLISRGKSKSLASHRARRLLLPKMSSTLNAILLRPCVHSGISSLYFKHLQHFVAIVVDDFDGDFAGFWLSEDFFYSSLLLYFVEVPFELPTGYFSRFILSFFPTTSSMEILRS